VGEVVGGQANAHVRYAFAVFAKEQQVTWPQSAGRDRISQPVLILRPVWEPHPHNLKVDLTGES
jgi:hypothetical protein